MALISHVYPTPLGHMLALFSTQGLCLLDFKENAKGFERARAAVEHHVDDHAVAGEDARTRRLGEQLAAYFKGQSTGFDVPLDLVGTPFQKQAWRALMKIPYGETRTYGAQARHIGRPTAVRAVANANGQNKISVVIPCHRVIGGDGSLTGYGGGLQRKQWLLALERGDDAQQRMTFG